MRWLITGSGGRLGTALIARLTADDTGLTGAEDDVIMPLDRASLDVTDSAAVREAVSDFRPDVVVNTAAYFAGEPGAPWVADERDGNNNDNDDDNSTADDDEQRVYSVNAIGPAVLALAVAATGGRLVHVASDLVFAGDVAAPYPVDAPAGPRSTYGRSKSAGELAVRELLPEHGYVVRTSWLYAGDEVVARAVRLAAASSGTAGGSDPGDGRRGSPTWVDDLAEGLIALSRSDAPAGTYHCTNSGQTTRLGFARAVRAELSGEPERAELERVETERAEPERTEPERADLDGLTRAAAQSVRSDQEWAAAGLPPMPDWRDALHRAFVIDGEGWPNR